MPLQPLLEAGRFYLRKQGKSAGAPERELVEIAIRSLGLDQLAAFDPDKKIIEYQFRDARPAGVDAASIGSWTKCRPTRRRPAAARSPRWPAASSAGLSAMVANLTVGKKGYEAAWDGPVRTRRAGAGGQGPADARGGRGHRGLQRASMAAMRMPKGTPEQQAARDAALEAGYQHAARVPLADGAGRASRRSGCRSSSPHKGNGNSASDAGVAALMARAGVEGAVLNVLINLGSVKDAAFRERCVTDTESFVLEATHLCEKVIARVKGTFKKA